MRENQKKIDSILINFFALPLSSKRYCNYPSHESYEDFISQPQTSTPPPEAACNTIDCKAFFEEFTATPPLVPCLVRAGRLVSPCYQQSYDGGSLCFWKIMPDCS